MTAPEEYRFTRYLAAKKSVDDRALNPAVRRELVRALRDLPGQTPVQVLEVGAGIGTMLERLLDWGMLRRAAYTGIDIEPENLVEARQRLGRYAASQGFGYSGGPNGRLVLERQQQRFEVTLEAIDLFDFQAREQGRRTWDLLIAHAFLDLVDLATALPPLFSLLKSGGLFYFTLNFDGATILRPPVDEGFDRLVQELYHQTMDRRRVNGKPAGSSRTGRLLQALLENAPGVQLLAAGRSDWVVSPSRAVYPAAEAYFLHFIIQTIHQALKDHPEMDGPRLAQWTRARHRQIERGELTYIARQWDFLGRKEVEDLGEGARGRGPIYNPSPKTPSPNHHLKGGGRGD
jgi:SAM-dependent methyltransferase